MARPLLVFAPRPGRLPPAAPADRGAELAAFFAAALAGDAARVGPTGAAALGPFLAARAALRDGPMGPGTCWPGALAILRAVYAPDVARAAWLALLAEPGSGWSSPDPTTGAWAPYCVPGYDPLCGDVAYPDCPGPLPGFPPAGQATAPAPPAAPAAPPVDVNADGSLTGIEGVLHQIAGALTASAVPALRDQILPVLQQDTALQATVGAAAGRAAAETLRPWVAVIAVSLAALAAVGVAQLADRRPPPPPHPRRARSSSRAPG